MKKTVSFLPFLIILIFSGCGRNPVFEENAKPVLVSNNFEFTEGPASDRKGDVYFTDQPNNKIYKWEAESGKISLFMDNAGRSNGLFVDINGNLISCADNKSELWEIDKNTQQKVLVSDFEGKRLNGPNDLWIDKKGGIYFTDPYYQRDYWKRITPDIKEKRVYYLSPDKKKLKIVAEGFAQPNGIIGSSKNQILYIADIGAGKTYSYKIGQNGELSHKQLFVEMGSDGMTMDEKGDVYLTGDGVTVFNKKGRKINHIPIDRKWTANVTFGGKNQQTLFITASNSVFILKMDVKGNRWE